MFNFFLHTSTYLYLYRKYRRYFIQIFFSVITIFLVCNFYDDLYKVFKVNNKDLLMPLFILKWITIPSIVFYNIYRLKKISKNEAYKDDLKFNESSFSQNEDNFNKYEDIFEKKKLLSTTDVLLKKYSKK